MPAPPEAAAEALAELEDRYGPAPDAVRNLLKFSALKGSAQKLGIEAIDRRAGVLNVKFHKEAHIDPTRLMSLVTRHRRRAVHPRRRVAAATGWGITQARFWICWKANEATCAEILSCGARFNVPCSHPCEHRCTDPKAFTGV